MAGVVPADDITQKRLHSGGRAADFFFGDLQVLILAWNRNQHKRRNVISECGLGTTLVSPRVSSWGGSFPPKQMQSKQRISN